MPPRRANTAFKGIVETRARDKRIHETPFPTCASGYWSASTEEGAFRRVGRFQRFFKWHLLIKVKLHEQAEPTRRAGVAFFTDTEEGVSRSPTWRRNYWTSGYGSL